MELSGPAPEEQPGRRGRGLCRDDHAPGPPALSTGPASPKMGMDIDRVMKGRPFHSVLWRCTKNGKMTSTKQ